MEFSSTVATTRYNFIDPAAREGLPRWKLELEARIYLEENVENFPDLVHVPYCVTPEAVLPEGFTPPDEIVHFMVPGRNRS